MHVMCILDYTIGNTKKPVRSSFLHTGTAIIIYIVVTTYNINASSNQTHTHTDTLERWKRFGFYQ